MNSGPVVVKVGGSLYDLPELGSRLWGFVEELAAEVLLVPGGGPMVDVLRALDSRHGLGADRAHRLALRVLSVNAHLLTDLLPAGRTRVIGGPPELGPALERGCVALLDCDPFCRNDPAGLPASWEVTSDSIAARAAVVFGSARLILLKSADYVAGTVAEARALGLLDGHFEEARLRPDGRVVDFQWINFRTWRPAGRGRQPAAERAPDQ